MAEVFHSLVLNLHQPAGNLEDLLAHKEQEAREILLALDRIPNSLRQYEDVARVHLSLSGTLLETLSNPDFQGRVRGTIDCSALLGHLQNEKTFEILGTGYYHPVFPLIPPADWDGQLRLWLELGRQLVGKTCFPGFWPPEMGFCMELIPHLKRLGYRYVLVDSEHVEPITAMHDEEVRYRPHMATFGGDEIIVVVRDRELSTAQEAGMDDESFSQEVHARTKCCNFPPLVTTCTNGDNGEWFRNTDPDGNFWSVFYQNLLQRVRQRKTDIRPVFISEYLDCHDVHGQVHVGPGAWNTAWHHGKDFIQWTGSEAQQQALTRVDEVSQAFHAARANAVGIHSLEPELHRQLDEAHWRILRAESSCHFFWGDAWVQRCHGDLDEACECLDRAWASLRA